MEKELFYFSCSGDDGDPTFDFINGRYGGGGDDDKYVFRKRHS